MIRRSVAAAVLLASASFAHAGEVYGNIGLPGVMLGYAHPVNSNFTVRGDIGSLGRYKERRTEDGIAYNAKIDAHRAGLFGDYFISGGLRLTAGVTFNNVKANLDARGDGVTPWEVGDTTFVASPDDHFNVKVEYPKTTPYLGIGYGHHQESGWGFVFDLGASFGKAKVSETHSGPNLGNPALVSQEDIDKEMAEVRDSVGKLKVIPQVSIGVNYRF